MSEASPRIEMTRVVFDEIVASAMAKEREYILGVFERDFDQRTASVNFEIQKLCAEVRGG